MVDLSVVFVSIVGATIYSVQGWLHKADKNENGVIEIVEFDPKALAKTVVLGAFVGIGAAYTGLEYPDLLMAPVFGFLTSYVDLGLKVSGVYGYLDELWGRLTGSSLPLAEVRAASKRRK